jgi:hypothetical protein
MGEEETMKKINFNINDGDSFYANEISITFGPVQFALDFKNISPRVDIRMQEDAKVFVMKHNVVLIDPFQAKQFVKVLEDALAKYELEFGTIEIPKAIKAAEEELKKLQSKSTVKTHDVPSYFG